MLENCKTEYIKEINTFIVEQFLFGEGDALKDDTSFLEEGIVDSTGILELVMFLEEKYGIKIEDSELVPENFDTLDNIAQYMEKKICAG
ncbi:acyl carrier protein [Planctomycetota bacterium]